MGPSSDIVTSLRSALVNTRPGKISLDLVKSMDATRSLAELVKSRLPEGGFDVVVSWDDLDNVVLAYELARSLGTERAYLQEDLGRLHLYGPTLNGARVALVTVGWDSTHALIPLRNTVEGAGAIVVAEVAALDDELTRALEAEE